MAKPSRIGRGFNLLVPIYDVVVKLVFGKTITQLQSELFARLDPKSNCLIIGGGSGEILSQAIDAKLASHFFYAELSSAMIEKTKTRNSSAKVQIQYGQDWKDWKTESFDYIILPFVLDCYPKQENQSWIRELSKSLTVQGKFIFIDFNNEFEFGYQPSFWKDAFIQVLYIFFGFTVGIEAKSLAPFNKLFREEHFFSEERINRYQGWIQAVVWKKEESVHPTA